MKKMNNVDIMNERDKKNKKAYVYTRVSTANQVDGYSLEGQFKEIKEYCNYKKIDIVNKYEDAGISGTSIQGRDAFQKMLEDIKRKKEVDYVIVWKLSRFGRNACDTLQSLETLKKYNVNLIATKESLNSEENMGDMMIKILSIVAEMERENIVEQTQNGKKYNALNGGWNGGPVPYGYTLENKRLSVVEEESKVVKRIYELFLSDAETGYTTIAGILNKEGIKPKQVERKSLKDDSMIPPAETWYNSSVKKILDNPIYTGKIVYGRDSIIKQEDGSRKRVHNDKYTLVEGRHEAIIDQETWDRVREKREIMSRKYRRIKNGKKEINNLLSQIAVCPECGNKMIATTESYKNKKGGITYYHIYACGYNNNHKGCCHKNSVRAERIDLPVIETLQEYIQKEGFIEDVKKKIGCKIEKGNLEKEIENYEKEIKDFERKLDAKYNMVINIDSDSNYGNIKTQKMLEILEKMEEQEKELKAALEEKKNELEAAESEKLTMEKIEYAIRNFGNVFKNSSNELKNNLIHHFVEEVRLERDSVNNKIYARSMVIKFTGEEIDLVAKNLGVEKAHDETVVLMSKAN